MLMISAHKLHLRSFLAGKHLALDTSLHNFHKDKNTFYLKENNMVFLMWKIFTELEKVHTVTKLNVCVEKGKTQQQDEGF